MKKFRVFYDFEEEEQFLSNMAEQGYQLEKRNWYGQYSFKESKPKRLNYRIDYRTFVKKSQFVDYLTLFSDAGWEHVYGTYSSGEQYFLPSDPNVEMDDIFSDNDSKSERYKRFSSQCLVSLGIEVMYMILFTPRNWSFFDLRSWYFTNGLWDMTGGLFWKALLFETPFVILRITPFVILLILIIINGYCAIKAKRLYQRS